MNASLRAEALVLSVVGLSFRLMAFRAVVGHCVRFQSARRPRLFLPEAFCQRALSAALASVESAFEAIPARLLAPGAPAIRAWIATLSTPSALLKSLAATEKMQRMDVHGEAMLAAREAFEVLFMDDGPPVLGEDALSLWSMMAATLEFDFGFGDVQPPSREDVLDACGGSFGAAFARWAAARRLSSQESLDLLAGDLPSPARRPRRWPRRSACARPTAGAAAPGRR